MLDLERKVFAEQLPDFVEPFARMTLRYSQQIISIGLATCGKGGARLAARLGIRTTRQTILRRIMELPDFPAESILFLGIDDFSLPLVGAGLARSWSIWRPGTSWIFLLLRGIKSNAS